MGKINDFGFPFASVTGDRQYSASEWRDYFSSLVTNGVVSETLNKLKINQQVSANKTVYVDTGSVVINGCMRILDTTQNITITDNTSGNPRIDRIVARLNYTDRKIEFAVLTGTPGGSPVAPTLTQNTTTYEISLAQIAVSNGFSTIVTANITDERDYAKTIYMETFDDENNLLKYNRDVTAINSNSDPTEVQYKRPSDSTLFLKRNYSNANVNGFYQTVIERFYLADGTTVYKTITYTLVFFVNGIVDTMTRVVA